MVTLEALRGYILEEMLARLLHTNGYRLLVSPEQDPDALSFNKQGLVARGRGADHQADVLGELTIPTPFSLPLRVFVEAKYRQAKPGIRDVRNAHGVIHDVNEQYATDTERQRRIPMRRHHYRYALFSTSGFSQPAQRYALAQQISLIDLSSPAFSGLLNTVDQAARELYNFVTNTNSSFPLGEFRRALRNILGTWTDDSAAMKRPDGEELDHPHGSHKYLTAPSRNR